MNIIYLKYNLDHLFLPQNNGVFDAILRQIYAVLVQKIWTKNSLFPKSCCLSVDCRTNWLSLNYSIIITNLCLWQTFGGRSRNCWKTAINKWTKTMEYKPKYRRIRTQYIQDLYSQRILSAVEEHGFKFELFMSSLTKVF